MELIFNPATIIAFSIFVGAAIRVFGGFRWLAFALSPLLLFMLMTFAEFVLPAKGGASFWPVGAIIAALIALVSSALSYYATGLFVTRK